MNADTWLQSNFLSKYHTFLFDFRRERLVETSNNSQSTKELCNTEQNMEQCLLLPREKQISQCVFLVAWSDQPVGGVWALGAFHSAVSVRFPLPALVCHLLLRLLHLSREQLALRDGVRKGPRAHDDRTKPLLLTTLEKDHRRDTESMMSREKRVCKNWSATTETFKTLRADVFFVICVVLNPLLLHWHLITPKSWHWMEPNYFMVVH